MKVRSGANFKLSDLDGRKGIVRGIGALSIFLTIAACGGGDGTSSTSGTAQKSVVELIAGSTETESNYSIPSGPGIGAMDGVGAAARFRKPTALAQGPSGNLYVADKGNFTIRKISATGVVSTLAGKPRVIGPFPSGITDGIGSEALFNGPMSIAVDAAENVYVADRLISNGDVERQGDYAIRKITPSGQVSTLAVVQVSGPLQSRCNDVGLAAGPDNSIYIAEGYFIKKISPSGAVSNFVGTANPIAGTPTLYACSIAFDATGNLYSIAYGYTSLLQKISPDGRVDTIAGNFMPYGSEPLNLDGMGDKARFSSSTGIAVDTDGTIYITTDSVLGDGIRKIRQDGSVSTVMGGQPFKGSQALTLGSEAPRIPGPQGIVRIGPRKFAVTTGNAVVSVENP
ncbi:hypothetical protein RY831_00990 [Noviherbaspirillum sp. CPCC 100848]|uniref:Teneurin NHL domain-containing protein n=1 Tax=Noviherbaspirillum album TaxID=3080276 RepID=A0ABU6J2U6_9BURK|nr:hypothetical protein [Noviherbaspirillum sp. CPCC 100848]MEC4717715.1 hypothetical protein [Noviherbaspirillum sp. CPCC 100848]